MTTLIVTRHGGAEEQIEVDTYDAAAIAAQINDSQLLVVSIGSQVFSRIDIKHIKPVEEATP